MTQATPAPKSGEVRRRRAMFTTVTVISFSMTLFVASLALFAGLFPLRALSSVERIDVATLLFVAPMLALVLAIFLEATRFALSSKPLPEPRRQQIVRDWTPAGRRTE